MKRARRSRKKKKRKTMRRAKALISRAMRWIVR